MKPPLISVVIPTYQRAHSLGRAIDSALAQTYERLEVVVSDNASTDGTAELLERYRGDARVRILRHDRNLGPVANWAAAIEASQGLLTKVNWSDDWMAPDAVERLAAALANDPAAGFAICRQTVHIGGDTRDFDTPVGHITLLELVTSLCLGASLPVSPGAALLHREDALWALETSRRSLSSACVHRGIGPDLIMLYGAFRRRDHGVSVRETVVHFEGGSDSITMSEDAAGLTRCYLEALDVLLRAANRPVERAVLRQLGLLRRVVGVLRGRSDSPTFGPDRLPLSAHLAAVPEAGASVIRRILTGSPARARD